MSTIELQGNFDKFTYALRGFAYKLTTNQIDAQDLYQETMYRAIKNKEKFSPGTNFKAWSMTIMKNIFINNYRRNQKRKVINDYSPDSYLINSVAKESNNAESKLMMDELSNIVGALNDKLKIPFTMYYLGHSYEEISEHLELPLGTIKSRIHLARKALKKSIIAKYGNIRSN